jgi:hypothetical protein
MLECLNKFGEMAVNCLLDDGIKQPSMNEVVWGLELALQMQGNEGTPLSRVGKR